MVYGYWMTGKEKAKEKYEEWWLHKLVRLPYDEKVRRVKRITLVGPPSFFYGQATIYFEDGTSTNLPKDSKAYKPRKKDLIVVSE